MKFYLVCGVVKNVCLVQQKIMCDNSDDLYVVCHDGILSHLNKLKYS